MRVSTSGVGGQWSACRARMSRLQVTTEAHSSQSGEMAVKVKELLSDSSLAAKLEEEAEDLSTPDQLALRAALFRGPQPNMSFFAFTATPKFKTLEMFGHKGPDGKPAPYHLYSMRQAIEEGFILDVLKGYTTYSRFFKLAKKIADDPDLDKRKASSALARFVNLHPTNIAQKTEIIIEHFRSCVMHLQGGRAKAMLVTGSRLQAVKYKLSFDAYLKDKGYTDVACLVAFSGEVTDDKVSTPGRLVPRPWPARVDVHEVQPGAAGQVQGLRRLVLRSRLPGVRLPEVQPDDAPDRQGARRSRSPHR